MKSLKIFLVTALLIGAQSAHAAWEPTKIKVMQVPINAKYVYVYFKSKVQHDNCDNSTGPAAGGAILRKSSPNFEEMYARIMIAQQNEETIQILDYYGECKSNFWIDGPYIRF